MTPDHRLVAVRLQASADDNCGPVTCEIKSVKSNESNRGIANWLITGDIHLKLRTERSAKGPVRIYTITIEASDAAVNTTSNSNVTVTMPQDRRKGDRLDVSRM